MNPCWKAWWDRAWQFADENGLDLLCLLTEETWKRLWRKGIDPVRAVTMAAEHAGCM